MVELRIDGADQQVANQPDEKQPSHDVHREIVSLSPRNAVLDTICRDVVDELRTDHRGHRPCRDQATMNRAQLHRAKEVAQVSRNRRKSAAVHRYQERGDQHESRHAFVFLSERNQRVQNRTDEKERAVDELAPVRSDNDDQKNRPAMLNTLSKPANPPPTAAETPNMSWHMSED